MEIEIQCIWGSCIAPHMHTHTHINIGSVLMNSVLITHTSKFTASPAEEKPSKRCIHSTICHILLEFLLLISLPSCSLSSLKAKMRSVTLCSGLGPCSTQSGHSINVKWFSQCAQWLSTDQESQFDS